MTKAPKSYYVDLGDLLPDRAAAVHGVGADLFSVREDRDEQRAAVAVALLERSVGAVGIRRFGSRGAVRVLDEPHDAAAVVEEGLVEDRAGHGVDARQGFRGLDGNLTRGPFPVVVGAAGRDVRIAPRAGRERQ